MHTKPQISRRQVLGGVLACLTMPDRSAHASPRILLRSSWQTVNIGDIAHTPGVLAADERVSNVKFSRDALSVELKDGRTITVPLTWYPRLFNASAVERKNRQIAGGGYGIHWPDIDEDLSTEGLLRGAPAPQVMPVSKKSSAQTRR